MPRLIALLALILISCSSSPQTSEVVASRGAKPLAHVARASIPPHPRLLATHEDFERVATTADPTLISWRQQVIADARKTLNDPPQAYQPAKGIEIARELQRRVAHLAAAFILTHEQHFLDRAKQNLLAACSYTDWSQPSFLATAEMTTSVAIGYDWLFDSLSESERDTIRSAIAEKGLRVGAAAYQKHDFWVEAKHNWNLVGNSGMIVGALAILDDQPDLAQSVFDSARQSLSHGLAGFAPDGGWEEGPTYWNYGSRYLCFAMLAMKHTTGQLFGLEVVPGLSRTGDFRIDVIGPRDDNFNFGDSTEAAGDSPQMFAAATLFEQPAYAAFEALRSHGDPTVFDLLWYRPADVATLDAMPKDAMFRGVDLATFRSAWRDPKATFVAFKGGSNKAHHGHFDLGTFVLDALGERWAIDLGSDDYGSPGYFGAERPTYYRCSTAGHNTIAFEGRNEEEDATAPLTAFFATKARAHAVIDLTNSYRNSARAERILRGIALLNRRDVLVQDEIHLERPQRVNWSMHTRAKVTVSGRTATLQQNGQTLTARLLYPPGISFEATPAPNPPKQSSNAGVTVLSINFRVDEPTHIAVLFSPGAGEADIPKLNPVSTWADSVGLGSKGQPHNEPPRTDRDIYAPPPPISFPRPPSRHK